MKEKIQKSTIDKQSKFVTIGDIDEQLEFHPAQRHKSKAERDQHLTSNARPHVKKNGSANKEQITEAQEMISKDQN